jgi:uncharacterized membrane protein
MAVWSMAALAIAIAVATAGAVAAHTCANALKRVAAMLIALGGAILALGVLGAPEASLIGAAAIAFAYCLLGVAVVVRVQEAYGGIETGDVDAADDASEPQEPQS